MGITTSKNFDQSSLSALNSTADTVTLVRNQTKHTKPYMSVQRNGKCGKDVWHYKTGDGKSQVIGQDHTAYCDRANPRVCFNKDEELPEKASSSSLDKQNLSSVEFKDYKSCLNKSDKCPVKCTYNINTINTPKKMETFLDIWKNNDVDAENINPKDRQDNQDALFKVMQNYCSQIQTENCLPDPDTLEPIKRCSRKFTVNEKICTQWYNDLEPKLKDTFNQVVCKQDKTKGDATNLDTDIRECKCINRDRYVTYKTTGKAQPINDGCWWLPCKNPGVNLISSDVLNPQCPDNICETAINISDVNETVTINDIKNNIICGPKKPKPAPAPDDKPSDKPDDDPEDDPEDDKPLPKPISKCVNKNECKFYEECKNGKCEVYMLPIYVFSGVLIFLILFCLILWFVRRSKSDQSNQ